MGQKHTAVIGLGSNVAGARKNAIEAALEWLGCISTSMVTSDIYETKPWGNPESGENYRNAVARIDTELNLETLNRKLKEYECDHGRDDEARREGRITIDLDIVIWDGESLRPREMERDYFAIGYKQTEER